MSRKRDSKGRFLKGIRGSKRARRNPAEEFAFANPRRRRRRTYRKNPSAGHYAKRALHHARGFLSGLGLGDAAKFAGGALLGMAASFLARKKFGKADKFSDKWEMRDYLMTILGGVGASLLAKNAFRASPNTAHNILKGSIAVVMLKVLQDQIIPQSSTMQAWFGGEAGEGAWNGYGAADPYLLGASAETYQPGDLYLGESGETFVMGEDGQWRPVDESHRMLGESLVSPGSLGEEMYGESLVSPGSLGGADPYAVAYARR